MALAGGISKLPHVSSAAALPRLKNINVRNFRIGAISRGKAIGEIWNRQIFLKDSMRFPMRSHHVYMEGKLRSNLVVLWAREP